MDEPLNKQEPFATHHCAIPLSAQLSDHRTQGRAKHERVTEITGLRRYPLARRGFVMTSLISGFTLATQRVEAQAIQTDTDGIDAGEVQIPVKDGQLPAYYARPATGTNFPVVLVNEEIFGVHEYIKDTCRRFAKLGYMAVAPEIYARIADLSKMTDIQQIVREVISKKPDAEVYSDLDATLAWAAKNKGSATAIAETGFCRGGRRTWLYAAHNPNLKAAVAWYGPVKGATSRIQPLTATRRRRQAEVPAAVPLRRQGHRDRGRRRRGGGGEGQGRHKTVELHVYPDRRTASMRTTGPAIAQADAEDGWNRMLAWFRQYGVAPKSDA